MKRYRYNKIKEIVQSKAIETQEDVYKRQYKSGLKLHSSITQK